MLIHSYLIQFKLNKMADDLKPVSNTLQYLTLTEVLEKQVSYEDVCQPRAMSTVYLFWKE